jgi:hypothetical protein
MVDSKVASKVYCMVEVLDQQKVERKEVLMAVQ